MPTHTSAHTRTARLLLALVASLLWLSAPPSHAAGGRWYVISVDAVGCNSFDWHLTVRYEGFEPGTYTGHTQVISDDKVYMNEQVNSTFGDATDPWELGQDFGYGAVANPGTWPIAPGKPMKVVLTMEQPKGTVLSSWTMVAKSCDSSTLLYNGPTAADLDEDYLATPADLCPALKAFRSNGCPLWDRTLTLKTRHAPKRVVGRLYAAGHPTLYAGRTVTVWRVRPGPDRKIATRTTSSLGTFKVRVGKGRYYATAPGLVAAAAGQVNADRSSTVRIR